MTTPHSILKVFFNVYMYVFGSREAARKLKDLTTNCGNDIDQLVNITFSFEYKTKFSKSWFLSIKPMQVKSEITELCRIVQELKPKLVVEIGTANGGTTFLFAHVGNPDKIISVDLPGGSFGGGYPFWKIPLFKSLGKNHVIQLIRADSHNQETLAKVKAHLNGGEVDFLFIDGDHSYNGVKKDFETFSRLVGKGGIVAFHDIVPGLNEDVGGVNRFWLEIHDKYKHLEIVNDWNQGGFGIGVLYF